MGAAGGRYHAMIAPGAPLLIFDEIDSTNQEARRRAASGERGPLYIMARVQSAGRGRRGRSWTSMPGNLLVTYLGATTAAPAQIALLGFAAGLALADVAESVIGEGAATLKWPNDLLLNGRKAAGILLECGAGAHGETWFAVGIGLNIAAAPEDAQPTAALRDFLPEGSATPDPEILARELAARLALWGDILARDGFAPLRKAWLARAHGLGGPIRVSLGAEDIEGVFSGLSENGELLLETSGGVMRRVAAGDIYFQPLAPA